MANFYPDSAYPVRADLSAIHARQFENFGAPGTWGTARQKLAIVTEARQAGYQAGVLEPPDAAASSADSGLSRVARRVVQALAVAPGGLDREFYDAALADGLSDAEYVEIVGLVARITCFDVFARGLGVPLRPLPAAQPGQPSRQRPAMAVQENAWAPTIPNGPAGGDLGKELFGPWKPLIMRGLSLVPDEFRAHSSLEEIQYMPAAHFLDWTYQHHDGLTRPQAEAIAARVSAINECFYWTNGHAQALRAGAALQKIDVNLKAIVDASVDLGLPGSRELLSFADAVLGSDPTALNAARKDLATVLGPAAVSAAASIAATFTKNDRIANGLGLPAEPRMMEQGEDIREMLGLWHYPSAENTRRNQDHY